jgi:peptidyl-prolyl cis-trans isomerase C
MTSNTHRFSSLGLGCALAALSLAACTDKKAEQAAAPAAASKKAELKNGLTEEQAKQVLVKVGDTTITLGEFADRLGSQSPYLRARYNSPERRKEFLDNMVRFELLALEAKKRGDDKLPDVERVRRQMMVQEMMKETFDDKGVKLSDISDEQIKAYYDSHVSEFHKPEQRRASHILFKDKAKAEAALKKLLAGSTPAAKTAGAAPAEEGASGGDDMELFRKLAKDDNQDPETKERMGDLRFFSREPEPGEAGPPKVVRDAAFSLPKVGDVYPTVVQSDQGFHIIKFTGERPPLDRTLQDAQRLIQNRLWREQREAAIDKFVAELRAKADVKENPALLSQVKVDTSGPALGPGGVPSTSPEDMEPPHHAEPKPHAAAAAPHGKSSE